MKHLATLTLCLLSPFGWTQATPEPPSEPELLSPGEDATVQNAGGEPWSFSWAEMPGISRYNVQVSARKSKTPEIDTEVTANSYTHRLDAPVGEKQLKRWSWRVRAFDGAWGPWSDKREFSVMSLQDTTNLRCYANVQDLIAWDYNGSMHWDDTSLHKLCDGAPDPFQPGACFDRIMHGGISWGGGTRWQTEYALSLCQRSANSEQTVGCFQNAVNMRVPWAEAIEQCSNNL